MITITVKQASGNNKEFGYGVYVNAYVTWDDFDGDPPVLYASECVSFGKNTPEMLKAAEKRVRARARYRAKKEWVDGGYAVREEKES